MTLGTHIVFGAVGAQLLTTNPVLGFCIGFASHFVLDAIPHWDYQPSSLREDLSKPLETDMKIDRYFFLDVFKFGFDFLLGFVVVYLFFHALNIPLNSTALIAGFAGALPDFLQFVFFKWRKEPLLTLQKFHQWIHTSIRLKNRPAFGIFTQVSLVVIFLWVSSIFLR